MLTFYQVIETCVIIHEKPSIVPELNTQRQQDNPLTENLKRY